MEAWTTRTVLDGLENTHTQGPQIGVGQTIASQKTALQCRRSHQHTSSVSTGENPSMSGLREGEQQHTSSLIVDHPEYTFLTKQYLVRTLNKWLSCALACMLVWRGPFTPCESCLISIQEMIGEYC